MNKDIGSGGIIPKDEPSGNVLQDGIVPEMNVKPVFVRILHMNDLVVFEVRSKVDPKVVATRNFGRSPGIWVKCEVGNLV